MWACSPGEREPVDALDPRDRRPRIVHREAELRVGLAGRDLLVRLAPHVRRHPHQHRLGLSASARPRRSAAPGGRSRRSCPPRSGPRATSSAIASSASDFALPCITIRSGAKPAFSARCSSPPEATSHHRPSLGEQLEHGGAGERLRGEHHVEVRVPCLRAGLRRTPARARADRPRPPRRRGCRTRAPARSCRSRPPPAARARSAGCRAERRPKDSSRSPSRGLSPAGSGRRRTARLRPSPGVGRSHARRPLNPRHASSAPATPPRSRAARCSRPAAPSAPRAPPCCGG